jgi:hypothetical protein
MVLSLLILGTPGIFSSMVSIAFQHRSGQKPPENGIDIIAACTAARSTDNSFSNQCTLGSARTCLPDGDDVPTLYIT